VVLAGPLRAGRPQLKRAPDFAGLVGNRGADACVPVGLTKPALRRELCSPRLHRLARWPRVDGLRGFGRDSGRRASPTILLLFWTRTAGAGISRRLRPTARPTLLDCTSRAQPKGRANSPGPRPIDPGTATPSHAGCNSGRPQSLGRRCSSTLAGRLKTRSLRSHPSTFTTLISVLGEPAGQAGAVRRPNCEGLQGSGGLPELFACFRIER
jgi:hypothetical protein